MYFIYISLDFVPTWPINNMPALGYIDGLVQDCSNSIASALELLQSYTKPAI